jgi:hypothetical protein
MGLGGAGRGLLELPERRLVWTFCLAIPLAAAQRACDLLHVHDPHVRVLGLATCLRLGCLRLG